ncbi:hypothetical protein HHK36_017641 [Tetracentron sinense]|uniref:Uncharacterized protein n=1 Tax=Tetracentron sinense TaxID=13715 RepID=A0A834YUN2_TETSI|nr:hypothetical protein HHK36_017641 [Tetracentron sinense]
MYKYLSSSCGLMSYKVSSTAELSGSALVCYNGRICLVKLQASDNLGLSWYINYESMFEGVIDQIKLVLIMSPLLLLLVVHWLSRVDQRRVPFFIPLPEKESLHRAGGTPWGVGALLVLLFFMISYQSYFHERWFPLLSR